MQVFGLRRRNRESLVELFHEGWQEEVAGIHIAHFSGA